MTQETAECKERNDEICAYIEASNELQIKDLVKSIGKCSSVANYKYFSEHFIGAESIYLTDLIIIIPLP